MVWKHSLYGWLLLAQYRLPYCPVSRGMLLLIGCHHLGTLMFLMELRVNILDALKRIKTILLHCIVYLLLTLLNLTHGGKVGLLF